jgi:hypothetical protein
MAPIFGLVYAALPNLIEVRLVDSETLGVVEHLEVVEAQEPSQGGSSGVREKVRKGSVL